MKQSDWDKLEHDLALHGSNIAASGRNLNEQRIIFPSLRYMYYPERIALNLSCFFFWLASRWFLLILRYAWYTKEADWFFEEEDMDDMSEDEVKDLIDFLCRWLSEEEDNDA